MSLSDEDIEEILRASGSNPKDLAQIVEMSGVEPTGDAVADVKAMSEALNIDTQDLLYGLFAEDSPLFQEDTWSNLTSPWDDENDQWD